jgi:hypothetical protein
VLVLPDADGLRVDLHQLGERVLQAPRDAHRAAQRHVEARELVAREVARRVDRRAALVHHHHLRAHAARRERVARRGRGERLAHELLGLARRGAVADGDELGAVPRHEPHERRGEALGLVQVPRVGVDHRAGARHGRDLHAGAEARVEPDHRPPAGRRGEQELLEVAAEDADRLVVGALLELQAQLDRDRRREQPLVRVLGHERELRGRAPRAHHGRAHRRRDLVRRRLDGPRQEPLRLAAPDGERPVRRHLAQRLREVVVVLELRHLLRLVGHHLRAHHALLPRELAHAPAQLGVLGHALGQHVACALQRRRSVGHLLAASTYACAACSTCASVASPAHSSSASGSRPRSRAIIARVRRFGLNGRYRSSSACFVVAAANRARSASVSFPCSSTDFTTAARRSSSSRRYSARSRTSRSCTSSSPPVASLR